MSVRDCFKNGVVQLLLLKLLSESDLYGYEIAQLIKERSGGLIEMPQGTMYPTLYKLQDNGYISDKKVQVGKRMTRIYYHLEPMGKEYLQVIEGDFDLFYTGIQRIIKYTEEKDI